MNASTIFPEVAKKDLRIRARWPSMSNNRLLRDLRMMVKKWARTDEGVRAPAYPKVLFVVTDVSGRKVRSVAPNPNH
jgi:hypothetical protein